MPSSSMSNAGKAAAVLYARVSTKEQEQEGFSIPAQLKLLREYAERKNLQIVREFTDAETAKQNGREAFNEMLAFLKANPQVRYLLCEKTDRLSRNFRGRRGDLRTFEPEWGRFLVEFMAWCGLEERRELRERVPKLSRHVRRRQ